MIAKWVLSNQCHTLLSRCCLNVVQWWRWRLWLCTQLKCVTSSLRYRQSLTSVSLIRYVCAQCYASRPPKHHSRYSMLHLAQAYLHTYDDQSMSVYRFFLPHRLMFWLLPSCISKRMAASMLPQSMNVSFQLHDSMLVCFHLSSIDACLLRSSINRCVFALILHQWMLFSFHPPSIDASLLPSSINRFLSASILHQSMLVCFFLHR